MRLALLIAGLLLSNHAFAEWRDWWQNADQRGIELLNAGEAETAAETFSDPQWRGTAKFRAEEYEQAAQAFAESESTKALYNRATALAHAGKLKQSLQTFNDLLKTEPEHKDGIANRDWVLKQLQQQQQEQQNQGQNGDQQNQQHGDQSQQQKGEDGNQDSQQQAGANGEDGRELSQDSSAGSGPTQAQQSAEESLKSALEEQQANMQKQLDDDPRNQARSSDQTNAEMAFSEQPYDETAQAVEQQLKRIPDDPAGLLRNKLYVTHQSRYADIREGDKPW